MFYSSQALKAAVVAVSALEAVQAQTTQERAAYPSFDYTMAMSGDNYGWSSYQTVTQDGYHLTMFRITSDANGTPINDTRGPILLTPGMYSSHEDYFVKTDEFMPSTPIQLANMGYDVWLGVTRGREYSNGHDILDRSIDDSYWGYSFEEIGLFDIPAMVDTVLAERPRSCSRVAVVGHSSAANATLVTALGEGMSDKVSRIVNLAPCINVNIDNFWIDLRDIASVSMLYNYFELNGLCSFDKTSISTMEEFCMNPQNMGLVTYCCNNFIEPAFLNPDMKEPSMRVFQHIHENTIAAQFQQKIPMLQDTVTSPMMPLYPIDQINIPVTAVFGENDNLCPCSPNQSIYQAIPTLSTVEALGANNYDLIGSNSVSLVDILADVEGLFVPDERDICPEGFLEEVCYNKSGKEVSCKSGSEKSGSNKSGSEKESKQAFKAEKLGSDKEGKIKRTKEDKYMAKYNKLIAEMDACVEEGIGSPMKIKKKLDRMNYKLADRGYTF